MLPCPDQKNTNHSQQSVGRSIVFVIKIAFGSGAVSHLLSHYAPLEPLDAARTFMESESELAVSGVDGALFLKDGRCVS